MRNGELKEKLDKALKNATPDALDGVTEACRALPVPEVRRAAEPTAGRPIRKYFALAAAALALMAIGAVIGAVINRAPDNKVYATVSIDVNPSLEIKINKDERVLEVIPLNADAKKVIGDMDFSGASIELAVNALIGSMYRHGYLSESRGTVLLSLDNEDALKTSDLMERLTAEISELLQGDDGRVIANTYNSTQSLKELAQKYLASESKAELISRLLAADSSWADMPLGLFSIETLTRLIASAEAGTLESTEFYAPGEGEITMDEALIQALALAGVADETPFLGCRYEYDETGWLVYADEALPGAPIARIKTAVENGRLTYFIRFSTDSWDHLIEMPADFVAGAKIASSSPSTGENPIPQDGFSD